MASSKWARIAFGPLPEPVRASDQGNFAFGIMCSTLLMAAVK